MPDLLLTLRGELAALLAALLWAISTVIFGRLGKHLPPLLLNLVKGAIAISLILLTLLVRQDAFPSSEGVAVGLLLFSGVIGIGLGDTAYFAALNHLGPRRVLLLESLAPPLAALIAWQVLGEQLGPRAWLGIGLTVAGVAWVITEHIPDVQARHGHARRGVMLGMLAALGQASGAVLSRAALAETTMPPLWSTLLRLLGGIAMLLMLMNGLPEARPDWRPLRSGRLLGVVAIAAFFGTYLAIWLQQTSLKYAPTGIAQSLTSTSPLFILPIAAAMGERISLRAVLGVLIALGGIWLLLGR